MLFRFYLNQRLVADLGRLSECGCRKADSNENEQWPHRQSFASRLITENIPQSIALCGPRRAALMSLNP
jgi:hypothetical protein